MTLQFQIWLLCHLLSLPPSLLRISPLTVRNNGQQTALSHPSSSFSTVNFHPFIFSSHKPEIDFQTLFIPLGGACMGMSWALLWDLQDGTQTLLILEGLYLMLGSWCSWSSRLGMRVQNLGIMGEGSATDWGIKVLWSTPRSFVSFCFIICRKDSPAFFGQQKAAAWTSNLLKL